MSTSSQAERISARLRTGIASAADLEHTLGASQAMVSRALRQLTGENRVLRLGSTRGARYGLRREIENIGSQWPLRRIDRRGEVHELGILYSLAADQYFLAPTAVALDHGIAWGGVSQGIPYFLQDQRPGGFLGRAVPRRYPELNLPQRVIDWTDDHYLSYLTQRGGDAVGDLILGDTAFNQYLAALRHESAIDAAQRESRYPELVIEVMQGSLPGSSAHGEHLKFTALLQDGGLRRVLVKFSPSMHSPVGRRWADLLTAEHHAHELLREAGVPTARSRILTIADRTYLEIDRFDRESAEGRIGVTSLWAIDTVQYGKLDTWIDSATRLHKDGRMGADTLEQVRFVAAFGALIANTDRHFGNLAFYDRYDGRFDLAPVYDMLPMLFAPEHDQILARVWNPPGPTSDTLRAWARARALAEQYWRGLTQDSRLSDEFREIGAACLAALEALPRGGGYADASTRQP